eukprot:403340689
MISNLLNQNHSLISTSDNSSESIGDMMENLSLGNKELYLPTEKKKRAYNRAKTQTTSTISRYQRNKVRGATDLVAPRQRHLRRSRLDLHIPESLRAIIYSYNSNQEQFLQFRQSIFIRNSIHFMP